MKQPLTYLSSGIVAGIAIFFACNHAAHEAIKAIGGNPNTQGNQEFIRLIQTDIFPWALGGGAVGIIAAVTLTKSDEKAVKSWLKNQHAVGRISSDSYGRLLGELDDEK